MTVIEAFQEIQELERELARKKRAVYMGLHKASHKLGFSNRSEMKWGDGYEIKTSRDEIQLLYRSDLSMNKLNWVMKGRPYSLC